MNKIIIVLGLLLLVGCSKALEQCDYKPFLDQNTNLITQNQDCQNDKNSCNINLIEYKNTNNVLKLQILNQNTTRCVQTSCNTVVRLLNKKEQQLEDCWFNSNATTHVTNYTYFNQTLFNLYRNCSDWRESINDSLN